MAGLLPLFLSIQLHYFVGPTTLAEQSSHDLHRRADVFEKEFVAGTQIVESRFAVRGRNEPIAWTLAVAREPHVALQAIFGQAVQLVLTECA